MGQRDGGGFVADGAEMRPSETGAAEGVGIVLSPVPRVRVRILDCGGRPVPGATVVLADSFWGESEGLDQWPGPAQPTSDVTGPDGNVVLSWGSFDGSLVATAKAPGYAQGRAAVSLSSGEPETFVALGLARGRTVAVKVVDAATRAPIEDAWLTLGPDVEAGAPDISALPESQQRSEVHVGRTGADGKPRPDRCLAAIPAGEKEPVLWEAWNACRTDSEGRFRIGGLTAGIWRIREVLDWRSLAGGGSGPWRERRPLDPDPGTPAGTKDMTLTWRW